MSLTNLSTPYEHVAHLINTLILFIVKYLDNISLALPEPQITKYNVITISEETVITSQCQNRGNAGSISRVLRAKEN